VEALEQVLQGDVEEEEQPKAKKVLMSDEEMEKEREMQLEETVEIIKPGIKKFLQSMKQGYAF
jgi:hypothetical protein